MRKEKAPRFHHHPGGAGVETRAMVLAAAISLVGHIVFFAALVLMPALTPARDFSPAVINVTMVSPASPGPPADRPAPGSEVPAPPKPAPEPRKRKETAPVVEPEPPEPAASEKAISLAPKPKPKPEPEPEPKPKPKPKKSLKKKTFKPKKVVKRVIQRIQKEVETSEKNPLQDTFTKLRESVEKQADRNQNGASRPKTGSDSPGSGSRGGGPGGPVAAGVLDIYMYEIALEIEQNWAYSDQLAGGSPNLRASLEFKVLPNGEIRDVYFTDRSGNRYLDESAYKAIMKSNPVKPHPHGVAVPYVQMGLRFTPEGIH